MPATNSLGPKYMKSLRDLLKGPMGIAERKDIVRYRALQVMGLVDGVGVRCVSLTKAGKILLTSGILVEPKADPILGLPEISPLANMAPTSDYDGAIEF